MLLSESLENVKKITNHYENEEIEKTPKNEICVNLSACKYEIVYDICKQLNWKIISNDEQNMNCDILWYDMGMANDVLSKMKSYEKVNHFPGIEQIARKNFLSYHLKKLAEKFKEDFDFFPETFSLPSDNNKFYEYSKINKGPYIIKPEAGAEGKGIFLVNRYEDIPENITNVVLQQYISNPLLVEGYKFDLRIYVLLSSVSPLTFYIFDEGICRMATELYEPPNKNNIENVFQHLTNYSINKNAPNFFSSDDGNEANSGFKRSLNFLRKYLKEEGIEFEQIWKDIKEIIKKTIFSIEPILEHWYNSIEANDFTGAMCFEILGFDIIINEELKPFLLEVNHAPSLNSDTEFDILNKGALLKEAFELLGINLNNWKEIIEETKSQFLNRRELGKFKPLSMEEKEKEKSKFWERYLLYEEQCKRFEKIHPTEDEGEKYLEWIEYSKELLEKKTGVSKEDEVKKLKKSKSVPGIITQPKEEKEILKKCLTKEEGEVILENAVNRLYSLANISKDENFFEQKLLKPQIENEKTVELVEKNVINLEFELNL